MKSVISTLSKKLQSGEITAVELTEKYISAIEVRNPELNAYVHLTFDEARANAQIADKMIKAFGIAGCDEQTLKDKFGALYTAFKYGAPPHAGMAPGVDRMIMLLRNEENIREVIAFPMSSSAQDLLCGAPNEVTETQLREVHIKIR